MKKRLIVDIIVGLLIILFAYTGLSKFAEYEIFKGALLKAPAVKSMARWLAWVVPLVEIAVSVLLAVPRLRLFGLYGSLSLLIGFTVYVAAILRFSENVPCTCGGVLQHLTWREHLYFNIVFLLLSLAETSMELKLRKQINNIGGAPTSQYGL